MFRFNAGTFFMLYSFAKILMTVGLRFFYRHIYTTGLENIPAKGPAIIIANHNASLMDAALLGILLKRKAYFFARGDVFVNKPIQKILWWLHMMPVHGHQGGRNTLSANSNSFSSGRQILAKGGIIVFFPESTSHTERQLLPFRKGVFRLAFDTAAASQFSFNIPVVPVGISYDHPVNCRTTVQVHAGKPLHLLDYKEEYTANAAAALLQTCRHAQQAIHPLVLHIDNRERLSTAEQYLIISRNNHPPDRGAAWKIASTQKLETEKNICATINNATDNEFEQKRVRAGNYFDALAAAGVTDTTVSKGLRFANWEKLLLWAGFPFFLLGLLLNGLPVAIARWIADNKVYRPDFYSWIFVACYCFIYFVWLVLLLPAAFLWGWKYALILLAVMTATGIFAYAWKGWLLEYRQQKNGQSLGAERLSELKKLRNKCSFSPDTTVS